MPGARDALRSGVAADSWAFMEAGLPLLAQVLRRDAVLGKRLLLAAIQILAAGGILGVVLRVGAAPSATENRRFAMAGRWKQAHASFEIETLLRLKLFRRRIP